MASRALLLARPSSDTDGRGGPNLSPGTNCLRYALYPHGDEWRFVDPVGGPGAMRVKGALLTNSGEALRLVAPSGQGFFLAPIFLVTEDLQAGRLVRALERYMPVALAINAIYPHRHQLSAKVSTFIDLAAQRFHEHQLWMSPSASPRPTDDLS